YVVRWFLEGAYARRARENPDVLTPRKKDHPIVTEEAATPKMSPELWAKDQVAEAEGILYRQKCHHAQDAKPCDVKTDCCMRCQECHEIKAQEDVGKEPEIVPTAIRSRFLPQSRFDHS